MRLTNEVVVAAPPDTVFRLLSDVERVAPCLPGAYRGRVEVRVGPIAAAYQGRVRMMEVDGEGRRILLDARGADQHGNGHAEARVDVRVRPHAEGSALTLDADLVIRGRVAQFGRGAIVDASQKLMEQFARNLESLLADGPAPAPSAPAGGEDAAAVPLLKRVAPVVGVIAAVAAVLVARRRRPGRG